jgi:hypothetical protein
MDLPADAEAKRTTGGASPPTAFGGLRWQYCNPAPIRRNRASIRFRWAAIRANLARIRSLLASIRVDPC